MRYISNLNISFSLLVNGVDKRFCFTPCTKGGSMYIAKSEDEIKALEASGMYGRVYKRMEGQAENLQAQSGKKPSGRRGKTASQPKDVKGIETWQEAVEYLVGHCGCDRADLMTPDDILAAAAQNNLRFPNIHTV